MMADLKGFVGGGGGSMHGVWTLGVEHSAGLAGKRLLTRSELLRRKKAKDAAIAAVVAAEAEENHPEEKDVVAVEEPKRKRYPHQKAPKNLSTEQFLERMSTSDAIPVSAPEAKAESSENQSDDAEK